MSTSLPSPPAAFTRRTLLAASAAGLALLAVGCTADPGEAPEEITSEQADALTGQIAAQAALVAAFTAAGTADPALGTETAELAAQAGRQLERLAAAAPRASASATATATPAVGPDPRAWLREQVTTTASSHAGACVQQSGARAALLGSIAAGLHGQTAVLS